MRKVLSITLSIVCLCFMLIESHAVANNGELTEEQKQIYWERLNFIQCNPAMTFENLNNPIVCFDISKSHELLIGFDDYSIVITDTECNVFKKYSFDYEGSFFLFWNNNNIGLILGRSDLLIEISPSGELIEISRININESEIVSLWNGFGVEHSFCVDGKIYTVKNDVGIITFLTGSYSQLTVEDENENTIVLFDSGLQDEVKYLGCAFFVVIICGFLAFKTRVQSKRTK